MPAYTECRTAKGLCDLAEYCNGTHSLCPSDVYRRNTDNCSVDGVRDVYQHSFTCIHLKGGQKQLGPMRLTAHIIKIPNNNSSSNSNVLLFPLVAGQLTNPRWWLGVRRVSLLALPTFVDSAASTLSLQGDILDSYAYSDTVFLQTHLSLWSSSFGDIPEILPPTQMYWDNPGTLEDKSLVEPTLTVPYQQASFLAAFSPHSCDWILAIPP